MNKIVKYLLIFLSVSMLLTSCKGKNKNNQPVEEPTTTTDTSGGNPDDAGDYYSSISDSLSGSSLRSALNTLNSQKKKKNVTYAGMRQFAAKCDIDPDGSGKIIGFYDNAKVGPSWDGGSSWNREHVWPNSRGGGTVEGDAHMPRPTSTKINSDRGSWGYSATGSYDPGMYVAFYRGVSARIIFYCMIANTNLKLTDDVLSDKNGSTPANTMGTLSDLLKWNLQYLPNASGLGTQDDLARRTELNRNNVIEKDPSGQGNRNPFIDHPEYACKIWGSTNSKTKQICGM
jgi:endonuclease I